MKVRLIKQRGTMELRSRSRLQRLMAFALELAGLGVENGTLNVVITRSDAMAEMNEQFLGHHGRTDVLTFDLRDDSIPVGDDDCVAEVYVCPEVAVEFSAKFGTSPSYELVLYIIHGMLHLAGEDDLDDVARTSMRQAEARLMSGVKERYNVEGFIG